MNNDWIIWNGGDCPVSPDTKVQPQFRYQSRPYAEENRETPAGYLTWEHTHRDCDIIAYRVVTEPLWAELTGWVDNDYCVFGSWIHHVDTHRIRIPVKIIDGKRVIDDSRQPVMEKI